MGQKHSGFGIASFVISIATGIAVFIMFIVAVVVEMVMPGTLDDDSSGVLILGLFIIAFFGVYLVGMGLGIAGLFQKDRKKIFAILGVIFPLMAFIGIIVLMIIGTLLPS